MNRIKSLIGDILSSRYTLHILVDLARRQVDLHVWNSQKRLTSELHLDIIAHIAGI